MSGGPGQGPRAKLPNGYGKPLHCPKCCVKEENFYGKLKLPGEKDTPCPNCGERLISASKRR